MSAQIPLFGQDLPCFAADFSGLRRQHLGAGAWVEILEGWLNGHGQVFEHLLSTTRWQSERRQMYHRTVVVPRLTARFPEHGPGHAVLHAMGHALSERYAQPLDELSAALYRDGRDSVAPHADRIARAVGDCVIAIVSLGEPRRFSLKPATGGPSLGYRLGFGDLLVMGGSCQRDWLHSVPKVAHAGPRISVQFRPRAPPQGTSVSSGAAVYAVQTPSYSFTAPVIDAT